MLWHLSPRERIAYVGIVGLLLFGVGYIGAQRFRQPAPIYFESPPTLDGHPDWVVDVEGAVKRPGLVHVRAGQRLQDALAAAGGTLPTARVAGLNLAEKLFDGQQITVPSSSQPTTTGVSGANAVHAGKKTPAPASISLNQASASDFQMLPGVGPAIAGRIVDYRGRNGRFRTVDELRHVRGIGQKKLAAMRPFLKL